MLIDACFRLAYRIAYRLMCIYWRLTRARTHGALVAIWHDGKVLLVRNSYVDYYSLPGGYLKTKEDARDAALRELGEELNLRVLPSELRPGYEETHLWVGKTDHVVIFDLDVAVRPPFRVDRREVVEADFFAPDAALSLNLFPPLRRHIEQHVSRHGEGKDHESD
ncbi:MAG: NUDIX domain-containing protein [Polyangiaceae bacterium]